jgi:methylisocitrate lyase
MHVRRTIAMSEAAGFAAIEIEDQLIPKRAHHHIGIEHMIPSELMEAKIRAAVAARRDPDFVIIGRTNALRSAGLDEALRRAEAYKRAGADMLYVSGRRADDLRALGERLRRP